MTQIKKRGAISIKNRPKFLSDGGKVAIVQKHGQIPLVFDVAQIRGPMKVTLAGGQSRDDGYLIVAKNKSIRTPRRGEIHPLQFVTRIIGTFAYWNPRTGNHIPVDDLRNSSGNSEDPIPPRNDIRDRYRMQAYTGGVPGLSHNDPEAQLVREYVKWTNQPNRFRHLVYLPVEQFTADLFDQRWWRLIETKVDVDRKVMRGALGQLYDYKRFFLRPPSLGVLVGKKPSTQTIEYFKKYHVTVMWRKRSGGFGDSSGGKWTAKVRL